MCEHVEITALPYCPLLHNKPNLPLPSHLRRVLPGILPAGRIGRESESGDHHPSGARGLPLNCRRNVAPNTRRYSSFG